MITVNITCMMVLASIYLSVSASLPITPAIKPVEVWLLLSLSYPFFIIVISILQQVRNSTLWHYTNTGFYISSQRVDATKEVERRERGIKRRNITVKPSTNLTLETKHLEAWSEDQFTFILSKTLDKSLKIYLPLVYVLLSVFYWIYNACTMTKIEI